MMGKQVPIVEQLQNIVEEFCTCYCKYPEQYEEKYSDPDIAADKMIDERCKKCPINKID